MIAKSPSNYSSPSMPSSGSMRSVPLGDDGGGGSGSSAGGHTTTIGTMPMMIMTQAKYISQLKKIRFLFEIFIACWAVWIVRRNVVLIIKLSPLVGDLAWGRCPLWILNIFAFVVIAWSVLACNNKCGGNRTQCLDGGLGVGGAAGGWKWYW